MAKILYLAHRVPFHPDKGDKIRAYHILEHLAARHDIWLGAGADDRADLQHLPMARQRYEDAYFGASGALQRGVNMALGALTGAPISVARFRHGGLRRWIDDVLDRVQPDLVYVFSSALAQYVLGRMRRGTRLIVDFVDADAEKWRAYAERTKSPMRWVYAAEYRNLVRFDSIVLRAAEAGILVSETERRLLAKFIPSGASKLHVIPNGVDTDYFRPPAAPASASGMTIVFAGTMDYMPNVDAVTWFVREIFPRIREACPGSVFRIVGAKPTAQVVSLAELSGVEVTGSVLDIRPHLFGAAAVVAPLRIARGIQNKVLEGMAAGRPMIATPEALDGIDAEIGRDVLTGNDAESFAGAVIDVLLGRAPAGLGQAGRAYVVAHHQWAEKLQPLDDLIATLVHQPSCQAPAQDR